MKVQTLAELKTENETKKEVSEENAEIDLESGETKVEEGEKTSETEEALESWQTAEDANEEEKPQEMPVSSHVKIKMKLKGRLAEKDSELEKLKAENETLKKGQFSAKPEASLKPRPKLEDFDFDDNKYQTALDKWDDERLDAKLNKFAQVSNQKEQLSRSQKAVEKAVEEHYERAAVLAEKSKISAEVYQAADMQFRQTIDDVFPGRGDAIADHLVSTIGENSEKVAYYIGRNGKAQNELKEALKADPSGVKAAIWIGKKTAEIVRTKGSQAPKPAPILKGDANANTSPIANKLKKEYEEAHKKGNLQKAWNLKKEAKEKGVDTKKW